MASLARAARSPGSETLDVGGWQVVTGGHAELPEGMTHLPDDAFRDRATLVSVACPSSLTSIGESAFFDCSSLATIFFPAGLTSIGSEAFAGCSSLSSITLPADLTFIDSHAFSYCSSLATIYFPAGLTSIGDCAFYECSSLVSIALPASLTSIGERAFSGCSALASVALPVGHTFIGYGAFEGCSALAGAAAAVRLATRTRCQACAWPQGLDAPPPARPELTRLAPACAPKLKLGDGQKALAREDARQLIGRIRALRASQATGPLVQLRKRLGPAPSGPDEKVQEEEKKVGAVACCLAMLLGYYTCTDNGRFNCSPSNAIEAFSDGGPCTGRRPVVALLPLIDALQMARIPAGACAGAAAAAPDADRAAAAGLSPAPAPPTECASTLSDGAASDADRAAAAAADGPPPARIPLAECASTLSDGAASDADRAAAAAADGPPPARIPLAEWVLGLSTEQAASIADEVATSQLRLPPSDGYELTRLGGPDPYHLDPKLSAIAVGEPDDGGGSSNSRVGPADAAPDEAIDVDALDLPLQPPPAASAAADARRARHFKRELRQQAAHDRAVARQGEEAQRRERRVRVKLEAEAARQDGLQVVERINLTGERSPPRPFSDTDERKACPKCRAAVTIPQGSERCGVGTCHAALGGCGTTFCWSCKSVMTHGRHMRCRECG